LRHRGRDPDAGRSVALASSGHLQIGLIQPRNEALSMYKELLEAGHAGLQHMSHWTEDYHHCLYEQALAPGFRVGHQGCIGGEKGRLACFDTEAHPGLGDRDFRHQQHQGADFRAYPEGGGGLGRVGPGPDYPVGPSSGPLQTASFECVQCILNVDSFSVFLSLSQSFSVFLSLSQSFSVFLSLSQSFSISGGFLSLRIAFGKERVPGSVRRYSEMALPKSKGRLLAEAAFVFRAAGQLTS
jgi:hypothetical protein